MRFRLPEERPALREVIARHDLSARRALGQHFLLDQNLTRKIARAAGPLEQSVVIEIGPGPGGLTRALLDGGARCVIAIERDERCMGALAELQAEHGERLNLVHADALAIDYAMLIAERAAGETVRIVANLPYNIATALLLRWLATPRLFASLTLMFQKEVALRLTAAPRSPAYGRLSVYAQWLCATRRLFDIPASAFVPPPKVTSSLVELLPRPAPLFPADPLLLERVTEAAFGQRRKMLRSSLKRLIADPTPVLVAAGIAPTARAEELPIEAFCRLARRIAGE